MPVTTKSLYGSIEIADHEALKILVQRLDQVAATFLRGHALNAFLRTRSGDGFYGLSREELLAHSHRYQGSLSTISLSGGVEDGTTVSVHIKYHKDGSGHGQFVIASASDAANVRMRDLLTGVWSPSEEELRALKADLPPLPLDIEPQIKEVETRFWFDAMSSERVLVDTLLDTWLQYFDEEGGAYRMSIHTHSGKALEVQGIERLRAILRRLWPELSRLEAVYSLGEEECLELDIVLLPLSKEPTCHLRVRALDAEGIREGLQARLESADPPVLHDLIKKFAFNSRDFYIREVVFLLEQLLEHDLRKWDAHVFLTSPRHGGKPLKLRLDEIEGFFRRYVNSVAEMGIRLSREATGQEIKLLFDFVHMRGQLHMLTGSPAFQKDLQHRIFTVLNLYSPESPSPDSPSMLDSPAAAPGLGSEQPIALEPGLCLVATFPMDEIGLWEYLEPILQSFHLEGVRADSLDGYLVLDRLWRQVQLAEWIMVDIDGRHAEAFYLLGLAHSLKKQVILFCKDAAEIPYDMKKHPYIIYDEYNRKSTATALEAIINPTS